MESKQPAAKAENSRFPDGFRILQGKQEYITYMDRSSIRVWLSDAAAHYDPHSHSAIEIILPDRGVSVYQVREDTYRVQPGEILIVPSDCQHALTEPPETQRYLLLFEPTPITGMRDMAELVPMMQRPIYLHDGSETHTQARELLNDPERLSAMRSALRQMAVLDSTERIYAILRTLAAR